MTQPEARLQRRIQAYLRGVGAFAFKVHGSEMMMAGLPDLTVCLDGAFAGIEVKMPGSRPTERQLYVHGRIRDAGGHVLVADSVSAVRVWVEAHRDLAHIPAGDACPACLSDSSPS